MTQDVNMAGDPLPQHETVAANSTIVNPAYMAIGAAIVAIGAWISRGGGPPRLDDINTIIGGVVAAAGLVGIMWRSHHNADKAVRIATNPANVAVSLK